jgi:hypothetical protein
MRIWIRMGIVTMAVSMRPAMAIGPAFGLERFGDMPDGGPQFCKHVFQHMVPLDQEPVCLDLAGRVAVADMPRDAGERITHISGCNLNQRFIRGHDPDQHAVFQFKRISMMDRCGLWQIDKEGQPVRRGQHLATQIAILIGEVDVMLRVEPSPGPYGKGRLGLHLSPHQNRK